MDMVRLCQSNRDGAFATQKNRQRGLTAMAAQLKQLGYDLNNCRSLKPKHVDALLNHWRDEGLTKATMRNRMSWLRWWAFKVNKISVLARKNKSYELTEPYRYTDNIAQALDTQKLNMVGCDYIKAAIMLQAAFGLRREEAIKFNPKQAIRKDCIKLKGSWTKGGRPRTVPITSMQQRDVLALALSVAGADSLIPAERTYIAHLKVYERKTAQVKLSRLHGLRHQYAQRRYFEISHMQCPLLGGPHRSMLTDDQYELDRQTRLRIAKELGHNRIEICDIYLGRLS